MSNFKRELYEVLADEAILTLGQNSHSNPEFQLEVIEEDPSASLKRLKLTHMAESDVCITFDVVGEQKFKTYSIYLKSSSNNKFNKRCDFIVARKQDDVWHVYFADLKSTKIEPVNILKQLQASQLFLTMY